MHVLAGFEFLDHLKRAPFCSVSEIFVANIYALKRSLLKKGSVNHGVFKGTFQYLP